MKKFILSVMTLCCAMLAQAENTDISTLDNVVYIEPVSIAAGSQYTLSVKMKNAVEAEGFGFDLYLPEGVSVATDGDGFPLVELSTVRTTAKKTNSFDAAFQSDGCLRVLAASTNASTISGNDGEVCLVTILVAANVSLGSYPMYLRNIAISDTQAQSHRTEQVESTITVTAPADTRTVLDETSTTVPEAATGVDVRVKRTIKANEWSTICLPFAMSEAKVKEAFGNDVLLGDFNGYETTEDDGGDITGITVKFNSATAIEANHPYIIKVSTAVTEFAVDGVDINPEETPTKAAVKRTKKQWSEMIGTYVANTPVGDADEEAWCLFLSGNQFWYSMGQTKMKAFRAYFDFYDVITSVENASAPVFFSFDNETTGISTTPNDKRDVINDKVIYNLNGRRVVSPKTGLFIKNGKKVIVK